MTMWFILIEIKSDKATTLVIIWSAVLHIILRLVNISLKIKKQLVAF